MATISSNQPSRDSNDPTPLPEGSTITFDYSHGRVFLHEGTIYYSPNCSRPVVIPPRTVLVGDPFKSNSRLDASKFKQPVWWSDLYGWLSFVPLSPTFTYQPFAPFCWMPRIERVKIYRDGGSEDRFEMHGDDSHKWLAHERLLVEAGRHLLLNFGISINAPVEPSSFHYNRPHKSQGVAKRMITVARDWLVIWMGFLSYIVSYIDLIPLSHLKPSAHSPLPLWYSFLLKERGYPDYWLDGLLSSTVCTFDPKIPRAGVVFRWTEADKRRPPIEWFYSRHVPLFFPWTSVEEKAILRDSSLSYLEPPVDLVQQALTLIFATPSAPLAALVLTKYLALGDKPTNDTLDFLRLDQAPSSVMRFIQEKTDSQILGLSEKEALASQTLHALLAAYRDANLSAAANAADLPTQSMIELPPSEDKGTLYSHYDDFFKARERRQAELLKVESVGDRDRREKRQRDRPLTNVYLWTKILSSGGREVYSRVRVRHSAKEELWGDDEPYERVYNAMANEWDVYEDFTRPSAEVDSMEPGWGSPSGGCAPEDNVAHPRVIVAAEDGNLARITPDNDIMGTLSPPSYSRDVLEALRLVYGYTQPLVDVGNSQTHDWLSILQSLGFVSNLEEISMDLDKRPITVFMDQLLNGISVPSHISDLDMNNYRPLHLLFNFNHVRRLSKKLLVFSGPRSLSCDWVLGIESADVALYICRYILENPQAHTIVTVAHRLLQRGMRFRTLLSLPCSPLQATISQPYQPTSFRLTNHKFTICDFETAMLNCQAVLSSPRGRAALMHGGIIGRIAREYLSLESVLNGPSIEVLDHRAGFIVPSGNEVSYCDDELTENEIAIICGTYSLYTSTKGQVATWSWFPPPSVWNHRRSGFRWPEWTERSESWFVKLLQDIRSDKSKPLSVTDWHGKLRGHKLVRQLVDHNAERSDVFLDDVLTV